MDHDYGFLEGGFRKAAENRKGIIAEELPRRKAFLGKQINSCLPVASAECYLNLGRSGFPPADSEF